MNQARRFSKLSWFVLGIGLALVIFGAVALWQQVQTPATVMLPPSIEELGSTTPDAAEAQSNAAKLASADPGAVVAMPPAEAPAEAPLQAQPAAPALQATAVPTVDVDAAVKVYQAAYPIPDHLWIDKLKVNAIVQPVGPGKSAGNGAVEWTSPNSKNVGWHDYSGRMGEGKNIVLNGHNNIYGAVFRKLYTLKAGDEIRLGAGDLVTAYKVEEVMILAEKGKPLAVRIQNAQYIQPMNDDRLTLISCWPENNNTHRVIVIARPIKP